MVLVKRFYEGIIRFIGRQTAGADSSDRESLLKQPTTIINPHTQYFQEIIFAKDVEYSMYALNHITCCTPRPPFFPINSTIDPIIPYH